MDTPGTTVSDRNTIHVPIEIIDEILHYLRTNKPTLQNCALVCRSWTPSCRRYIFCRVTFAHPSDFARWRRSISAQPNGPHLHTRQLLVDGLLLAESTGRPPDKPSVFLQYFILFSNVQDLVIDSFYSCQKFDNISVPDVFGHLSNTLRSLTMQRTLCSPQALISFVASFQHLERLQLMRMLFDTSESLRPTPKRHTFKGIFSLVELKDPPEEFVSLLTEHDLQYCEMCVWGERWLRDTTWNKCLVKCADHLEKFTISWLYSKSISTDPKGKALTFKNLRKLSLRSSASVCTTILPPPDFLSSITSRQLSEIVVDMTGFSSAGGLGHALNVIRSYDEALCQLSDQLEPSSVSEKLAVTLRVFKRLSVPDTVLPRFSEVGVLKIVRVGI